MFCSVAWILLSGRVARWAILKFDQVMEFVFVTFFALTFSAQFDFHNPPNVIDLERAVDRFCLVVFPFLWSDLN